MTREAAYIILTKYITNPNLIKHSLACEVAMKALYKKLNNPPYTSLEEEKWGITGLLHDGDYEMAKGNPNIHGLLLFEKEPASIPLDIARAIKAHNWQYTKVNPQTPLEWAIACCDQLTGLIVASTLVTPEKKLAVLTPEFVLNRFHSKNFAKGADRKAIELCEKKLGIPLLEFIKIVLDSMKTISTDLGL